MTLSPALARRLGRDDRSRSAVRSGGRGQTLAGFEASTLLGPARARGGFSLDTGTVSAAMLAGIVIGLAAFYLWTRSHQG